MDKLIALFFLLLKEWPTTVFGAFVLAFAVYGFFSLLEKFLRRFLKQFFNEEMEKMTKTLTSDTNKIKKLLNNHITDTTKEIKKLADGQTNLKEDVKDLRDKVNTILECLIKKQQAFPYPAGGAGGLSAASCFKSRTIPFKT